MVNHPAHNRHPLGGLHYLLMFSAFGLLMLVVIGPKYQQRQAGMEQQFNGVRNMQQDEQARRGAAADARFEGTTDPLTQPKAKQPLLISLRPLMLYAALIMMCAWAGLQWRRMERAKAGTGPAPLPPAASPSGCDQHP